MADPTASDEPGVGDAPWPPPSAAPRATSAPPRQRHSFGSDVTHSTATLIVIAVIGAITGVIAARLLQPTNRGELAAIFLWPTILSGLATLGMSEALVYFCARRPSTSGRYLGTSLAIAGLASLVLAAVGWVIMPFVLYDSSADVVQAARWYLLQVPVGAALYLAARPLRGVGDIRAWNYLRATHTLVWLAVLLVAWARGDTNPASLALAFVLGRAVLVPVTLLVVRWRLRQPLRLDRSLGRGLLRYGLPNTLAAIPNILNLQLDQLLIAPFFPSRDLGLYVVAVSWSQATTPVLLGFTTVFFPRVAEVHDTARQAELAARGTRTAVVVALLVAVAAGLLAPVAVPLLFGTAFADAVPAAVVLCVAAGVLGVVGVQQEAARGLGRPLALLYGQLAGLSVTAIGLAFLLPRFGILGAAIASLAGYAGIAAYLARYNSQVTDLPWRDHLVPRRADLRALVEQLRHFRRPERVGPSS